MKPNEFNQNLNRFLDIITPSSARSLDNGKPFIINIVKASFFTSEQLTQIHERVQQHFPSVTVITQHI